MFGASGGRITLHIHRDIIKHNNEIVFHYQNWRILSTNVLSCEGVKKMDFELPSKFKKI